jgi:hypothetical protein
MEPIWFIEIQCIESDAVSTTCFKTKCNKYNTAMQRAWKWCDKNNKIVNDIFVTRLVAELNHQLDEYTQLK